MKYLVLTKGEVRSKAPVDTGADDVQTPMRTQVTDGVNNLAKEGWALLTCDAEGSYIFEKE